MKYEQKGSHMLFRTIKKAFLLIATVALIALASWIVAQNSQSTVTKSYIISSTNLIALKAKLDEFQVVPTHELTIIDSLVADLTEEQLAIILQDPSVRASENYQVEMATNGWRKGQRRWQPMAIVPDMIDADVAHHSYNFGDAVTIGFLDTGLDQLPGLSTDLYGEDKAWGTYDSVNNSVHNYDDEASGHGTHVASIANNSDFDPYGRIYGVAPNAPIVGIKAFDKEGKATYADVIRGIDWALKVKDQINLRILNMSFSGAVRSYYWDDPLNKAVMKAWQAGIVVVASSGNKGPDPMTIGVPGNVPYIITVGAMTDSYTSSLLSDDALATFSSAGPTAAGFVKPDVLAPGGHLPGLMSFDSQIVLEHPEFHDGGRYFEMSGTSQAAAVVSGVVALMLTNDPNLSPDDVKCRLMDSAHAAKNSDDSLAYSIFQQGAGVVNAADAIYSSAQDCANQSLDIAKDLSGEQHYYGPANITEDGDFYIDGLGEEYVWHRDQQTLDGDAIIWKVNYDTQTNIWQNSASTDAIIWKVNFETDAIIWKVNLESDAIIWKVNVETDAIIWKVNFDEQIEPTISVNHWVDQQ